MTVAGQTPHGFPWPGDDAVPSEIPIHMQNLAEAVVAAAGTAQQGIAWAKVVGPFSFGQHGSVYGWTTIPLPTIRAGGVMGAIITPINEPWFPRITAGIGGTPGVSGAAAIEILGYATNIIADGQYTNGNNTFTAKQFMLSGSHWLNLLAWGIPV